MSFIQRFLLGNRVDDDLQVGLFLKNDGTVWLRNPDGSETQLPGGGGGSAIAVQDTDPGATGAGSGWLNTTPITGTEDRALLVRDPTNTSWIPVAIAHYDADGNLRGFVTNSDGAMVLEHWNADGSFKAAIVMDDGGIDLHEVRHIISSQNIALQATDAVRVQAPDGLVINNGTPGTFQVGTADPSADAGLDLAAPALYMRLNDPATELWVKSGPNPTDWVQVAIP